MASLLVMSPCRRQPLNDTGPCDCSRVYAVGLDRATCSQTVLLVCVCLCAQVRLPFLTSSFVGDILHAVPWIRDALDNRQLLNAFQ